MSNVLTSSRHDQQDSTPTDRKTLVFFVGTDPATDPGPLQTAQHFAAVAAGAGLQAELRLAGRAVRSLGHVAPSAQGVDVTVCPRGIEKYGVSSEIVAAIGGRPRTLAEILTEVADGQAVLIPVTHSIDDPKEA